MWKRGANLSGRSRDGTAVKISLLRVTFLGEEGLLHLLPWQEEGK